MPKPPTRTTPCNPDDARARFQQAQKFQEAGELILEKVVEDPSYSSVVASLAVLSGIASTDAACCFALRERSRSQDHHDAVGLVANIKKGGSSASQSLARLLDLKNSAQYGAYDVGAKDLRVAIRHARSLLEFAATTLGPVGPNK